MPHSVYTMSPGERAHEHMGRLVDGRQVLVTTRFGPSPREEGELVQLTLLVFDAGGSVLSSETRVLGLASELPGSAREEAIRAALSPLGPFESSPIDIQAVPLALLGGAAEPLTLECEEETGLSVTLANDGFFVPGWPFRTDD